MDSTAHQQSNSSDLSSSSEVKIKNEVINSSPDVDCSNSQTTTESGVIDNDPSSDVAASKQLSKTFLNEAAPSVAVELGKRLKSMDNSLKKNKFIKGLGNFMVGVKNKMTHNEPVAGDNQLQPPKDVFLKQLKQMEIPAATSQDQAPSGRFKQQLVALFEMFDVNCNEIELTEECGEVVVRVNCDNVKLAKKLSDLKDILLEAREVSSKKDLLKEEITLYMKYFHSLKDLFEINGSIYLDPLETRLQKLYTSAKVYLEKLENQIKKYDAVLAKFEKVAELNEKKSNQLKEDNKTLKATVSNMTLKIDQTLCLFQEIETLHSCYLATVIHSNIQQNNLNQFNQTAKHTQTVLAEKKTQIKKLHSDIELLLKENLTLENTVESQTQKINILENESADNASALDSLRLESSKRIEQLEDDLQQTKHSLQTSNYENITFSERVAHLECQIELDRRTFQVKTKSLQQLIQSLKKEKDQSDSQNVTDGQISPNTDHQSHIPLNQDEIHSFLMLNHSLKHDIQTLNDELNDKNIIIEQLSSELKGYKTNSTFNLLMGARLFDSGANDPQAEANVATTLQALVEDLIAKNLILEENVSTLAKEVEALKLKKPSPD